MAHLPPSAEELDELEEPLDFDPVVRQPKQLATLEEPPSFERSTLVSVSLFALLFGASLGVVGLGITHAVQQRALARAQRNTAARNQRTTTQRSASATIVMLEARGDAGAPGAPTLAPIVPRALEAENVSGMEVRHSRLGRGRTLPVVLRSLGASRTDATRVSQALRRVLNMRMLRPDDVVLVLRDPSANNEVRRVEYRRSETQVWAATPGERGRFEVEQVEVVRNTERTVTGFVVGDVLEDSLRGAGLRPDIIPRLQEAFTAMDLGRELRRGDTVRLVVPEERLNRVFFRYGPIEAIDYRGAMGRRRMYYQAFNEQTGDWFDAEGMTAERGPLRAPVVPARLTSPFNLHRVHPVLHRVMPHMGCDFGATLGTPVYAAAEGTVLSITTNGPPGNLVRLSHPTLQVETGYAHLSRFVPSLRPGMTVRAQQIIGYVGSTGRSTGPHLHFSLKREGRFIDPATMFHPRRPIPDRLRAEFLATIPRLNAELNAVVLGPPVENTNGEETQAPEETPASPATPVSQGTESSGTD